MSPEDASANSNTTRDGTLTTKRAVPPMQIKMLTPAARVVSLLAVLHSSPGLSQLGSIWTHNGSLISLDLARG